LKTAWFILIISSITDFIITTATALTSAMVAMGNAELPGRAVVLLAVLGGAVSASRTIQQALKATPETSAALRGDASIVATSTVTKTP
jgi:hypothetical protein